MRNAAQNVVLNGFNPKKLDKLSICDHPGWRNGVSDFIQPHEECGNELTGLRE